MWSSAFRRQATRTAAALLVGLALPAGARAEEPEVVPDFFQVTNTNRDISGSLDNAILGANGGSNTDNVIQFGVDELQFLSMILSADLPLPAIDLLLLDAEATRNVDLDATGVTGFQITTATDAGEDFTLLHIKSGQATLVDLEIFGGAELDDEPIPAQFLVDAGAALAFRYSVDYAVADNIVGEGQLVKDGDSMLELRGTNTYLGGTEVLAGELRGHADSLQGDVVVKEGAVLTWQDDGEGAFPYDGEISGEGRFVKQGTRDLQFATDGLLTVTGGSEIREGALLADAGTIAGDVIISANATFELYGVATEDEFAGDISGAGQFRKTGTSDLLLTGANSFTGGIEVNAGRLIGNAASLPGDIDLPSTSSEVLFSQTPEVGDGVHTGNISGLGKVTKKGTSILTLAGTSSHIGGTFIEEGTLRGDTTSLVGEIKISAGATSDFALADFQTFGGVLSGAGDFSKSGSGTLELAAGQELAGAVRVEEGTLRMLADLTTISGVVVESGGAILENAAGSLSLSGGLTSRGQIKLGGVSDSLTVGGDVDMEPGSVLSVAVNDQGQSSLLVAGDNRVDLDNIVVSISPAKGLYTDLKTYEIMHAFEICTPAFCSSEGGIEDIGTTTPDFAFLDIGPLTVQPRQNLVQKLTFTLVQNSNQLDDYAQTPNQKATAPALDQLLDSGSPDALDIGENLSILTSSQVPGVLNQVAGESLGAFTNPRQANAFAFGQAISRRFTANDYEDGPVAGRQALLGASDERLGAAGAAGGGETYAGAAGGWLDAGGLFSERSGEVNASTISSDSGGLAAGFDASLPGRENWRLGVGLGYTRYSLEGNRGLSGEGNTYQVALYGSWEGEMYYAGLAGRYAYTDMETDRRIAFEDIDRQARADSSGQEAGFLAEAGMRLGDPTRLAFRPMIRVQYNHLTQDAFRESGGGDLSLATQSETFDSWQTTLGARISTLFTLRGEFGIEPEFRAGWTHDFGDLARPVTANFYNVPGATPFVTTGAQADPDHLFVGTGYLMSIAEVPLVGLDYDYYTGDGYHLHVVSAQLYLRW